MDKLEKSVQDTAVPFIVEEYNVEEIREEHEIRKEAASKKKDPKKDKEVKEPQAEYKGKKSAEELRSMSISERKRYWAWCRDRDQEKVKAIFRNFEQTGGTLHFPFRKWAGEQLQILFFEDGKTYDVPREIVDHLNNNCWYPAYEYLPGGKIINVPGEAPTNMRISKKNKRFALQVIDAGYDDYTDDAPSPIVAVEYVGLSNQTHR